MPDNEPPLHYQAGEAEHPIRQTVPSVEMPPLVLAKGKRIAGQVILAWIPLTFFLPWGMLGGTVAYAIVGFLLLFIVGPLAALAYFLPRVSPSTFIKHITCTQCGLVNDLVDEFLCDCGTIPSLYRSVLDACQGCGRQAGHMECGRCHNMVSVFAEGNAGRLPFLTREPVRRRSASSFDEPDVPLLPSPKRTRQTSD